MSKYEYLKFLRYPIKMDHKYRIHLPILEMSAFDLHKYMELGQIDYKIKRNERIVFMRYRKETSKSIYKTERRERVLSREEIKKLPSDERMKFEIADELGLYDKVLEGGWKSLTSQEAGRIGGIMAKRRRSEHPNRCENKKED